MAASIPDHRQIPGKRVILLSVSCIAITLILIISGTAYAIWSGQHSIGANNLQWCNALAVMISHSTHENTRTDLELLRERFGC
jgi:hypothetical protein